MLSHPFFRVFVALSISAAIAFSCSSGSRRPASEPDGRPHNPFSWNSWLRRNYPDWYYSSTRLEADPRPWPKPFDPAHNSVFAHNEIFIPKLDPQAVLKIMASASDWADFYPNSDQPVLEGTDDDKIDRLSLGMRFVWTTFGVKQHMKVSEYVESPRESVLAWTGGSPGTSVYHRWMFHLAPGGGTLVTTEECEVGLAPGVDAFLMNPALHAAHQLWLENLKKYALDESLGDLFAETNAGILREDPEILGINLSWLDFDYAQTSELKLVDGVIVSLGAGGNSVIVSGKTESILIDTKFDLPFGLSRGATRLHDWIQKNVSAPVNQIVNTHYHYDHTYGNILYSRVRIYAHPRTLELMREQDGRWWSQHPDSMPFLPLDNEISKVYAGTRELEIHHSVPAHTSGDLWIYLPAEKVVVLGDLMFHTYYPFFDDHGGGSSLTGTIETLRLIAKEHPDARFVPGHGPVCGIVDVERYIDYLEGLYKTVKLTLDKGLNEQEAVKSVDFAQWLTQWHRKVLPSYHDGNLKWATARSSFLGAFRTVRANGE